MTAEDARKLKVGDSVLILLNKEWKKATVLERPRYFPKNESQYFPHSAYCRVRCRREGVGKRGIFPAVWRTHDDISLPDDHPNLTANVYADYLEDHGFLDAANCLRERFSL